MTGPDQGPYPPRPRDRSRGRLPTRLTSFIGRERELRELSAELAGSRLVTLVGAGGMGKTRLALHLAAATVQDYPDGIWFVELAPLAAGSTIDHAVATTLGFQSQVGLASRELIRQGLASWRSLLVLDNCEHVLDASRDLVNELLEQCDRLSILTTSRAPLRVPGERVRSVGPLDLATDATALLAERAAAARPGFSLGRDGGAVVTSICEQLDGMPLAIELAAARLRSMTPAELLEHLGQRFRLLRADRADTPFADRHATLTAVVDWSYDLLRRDEQGMLCDLGVFAGGFDLAAAHAVRTNGADGVDGDELDTLDLIDALVDQSLVQTDEVDGRTRYGLLETLRRYIDDRQTDEVRRVRRVRHAAYFLAFARTGNEGLKGRDQVVWLRRLEREHDNFRAALLWSLGPDGDPAAAWGLGASLGWFWRYRSHLDEGRAWLNRVLAQPHDRASARDHTWVLVSAGLLDHNVVDYRASQLHLERARSEAARAGDGEGLGWALHGLGRVALALGDRAAARALLDQSIEVFAERSDGRGIAYSKFYGAAALLDQTGDVDAARRLFDEAVDAVADLGDTWGIVGAHVWRGAFAGRLQQEHLAPRDFGVTLAGAAELGSTWQASIALFGLARTAARQQRWTVAARLFGAAQTACESVGGTVARTGGPSMVQLIENTREALGTAEFEAASSEGRALAHDEAVDMGCRAAEDLAVPDPPPLPVDDRHADLTGREGEVARLVAEGRSNKQIAADLHLSVRTVENHLSHVYAKLGLVGRSELIVFVLQQASSPA